MKFATKRRRQRGQTMTEYIIIVALIAVAAIGVYSYFGTTVREQSAGIANEIAGNNAQTNIDNANAAAGNASTSAATNKGLANYNEGNNQQGN